MEVVRFALLGLGAGSVYALIAFGVVLTYRGSSVLNFSQGAIGMISAFVFYIWWGENGGPAFVVGCVAVAIGVLLALAVYGAIRLLGDSAGLSKMIVTLAALTMMLAAARLLWGTDPRIPERLLPTGTVDFTSQLSMGVDRLVIFIVGVVVTVVLGLFYARTRFGLVTTAVAENAMMTARHGVNPNRVAAINWAIGGALSALAGILVVALTGLQPVTLALLIVPALAAALVGGFRSFPLTLLGGLAIGILQSEASYLQVHFGTGTDLQGLGASIPFVVIVAVLLVRPQPLPLRGAAAEHLPRIGMPHHVGPSALVGLAVAGAVLSLPLSGRALDGIITWAAIGVVIASLVVVTGYAGQVSLAQVTLAGMGAWVAARLVADHGMPVELAMLIGIASAVPIGVVVGLPALRSRGVNLAVATLALALVIESVVLTNSDRTGGVQGTQVGSIELFGIPMDAQRHADRYAALVTAVLVAVLVAIALIRRSRWGDRMIAVRTNERAAASLGISVTSTKLSAFALSSAIAAVGGVLIAFRNPTVSFFPTFSVLESISVLVYAVIGGIGFLAGAVIGAVLAPGSLLTSLRSGGLASSETTELVAGGVTIAILAWLPNGVASLARGRRRRRVAEPSRDRAAELDLDVFPRGVELRVEHLRVQFGGVVAVDDVSLSARPGEVLGLIGPNGAGKTTCIDALTGFTPLTRGSMALGDTDVTRWGAARRARSGLGRTFQTLELFDDMSVVDNLRAAQTRGRLHGRRRDGSLPPPAQAAVELFGLQDALQKKPSDLSNGGRRMVAIARALAAAPSVLLLDEPAAGLSGAESEELGVAIRKLADRAGTTVVLVEHDVSLVMSVCDRVCVLDLGRKLADGQPEAVRKDAAVRDAYLGSAPSEGESPSDAVPLVTSSVERRRPPDSSRAPAEELLSSRGLVAGYGAQPVVHGLDLTVRSGEIVALMGANGAGKTTTVMTIAGELQPLAGDVVVLGHAAPRPLHTRATDGVGLVPEGRGIIRQLSVRANLRLAGGDPEAALEYCPELADLMARPAGLLSGGEQQLLALAATLVRGPKLMLIDELSFGLAPIVTKRLLLSVRRAADTSGIGVLLVEQDVRLALEIADRAHVLRRGETVLEGAASSLIDQVDEIERAYLGQEPARATAGHRR